MKNVILFLITLLPVMFFGVLVYLKDKNKEPKKLLFKLFLGGVLSVFLTIIISTFLEKLSPILGTEYNNLNLIELMINIFIATALTEEFSKWIILYLMAYNEKEYDEPYDMIVYAVFIALGFAAIENVGYVFVTQKLSIALLRAFTAVPVHICCGIFMGSYLTLSKMIKNVSIKKYHILFIESLLVPVIIHGVYDYCLLSQSFVLLMFLIVLVIMLYVYSIKRIKIFSKVTSKIKESEYL